MAKNFPKDEFKTLKKSGTTFTVAKTGIAGSWYSKLFKRNIAGDQKQWTDVTDERFINWMKSGSLSTFPKLYGVINSDVDIGDWQLAVQNVFNPTVYGGKKKVILSTSGTLGAKKIMPAVLFVILGSF